MKIFLVGMPGSGKTTLGRALAERLGVDFVDLDAEIEKAEGTAISNIFSQQGEDHFRLVESQLLGQWSAGSTPFVMATGGGAPCFHRGMEVINQAGVSVFLDCPVPKLVERVRHNQERPLLLTSGEDELRMRLERMRDGRLACYRQAKIILENPTLDALLSAFRIRK